MDAPKEAKDYYTFPQGAKMRDMILAIRADEASHRDTNHHFSDVPKCEIVDEETAQVDVKF